MGAPRAQPLVLVHGGAGFVPEASRAAHAERCAEAAAAGLAALLETGDPLEAAVRAVAAMESMPCFNAGTGGALNEHGELELDASVMLGRDLRGGAVGALPPFLHPVEIARAVMEEGTHVFYAGEGAAAFAEARGFVRADPGAMITASAKERLAEVLGGREGVGWAGGTVGAVARDAQGHVAAATSTGGTVGKRRGRIGDTPILGAGTWADDRTGACSATGIGEQILRYGLARSACEGLRGAASAQEAAERAIAGFKARVGGSGGILLLGPEGPPGMARNTETMSWAWASPGEARQGW